MVFSSVIFIFAFLPVVLLSYCLAERSGSISLKNGVLLLASLVFYAWGGLKYLVLLLALTGINYLLGIFMGERKEAEAASDEKEKKGKKTLPYRREKRRKGALLLGILIDLGVLFFYKYLNFVLENLEMLITALSSTEFAFGVERIPLPIGISFFTFQILSYLIDVYRGTAPVQKNPLRLALYIMMFPQLIAGPIVRYGDVNAEIGNRQTTWEMAEAGTKRFILGFGKKVFLANAMGGMADTVFNLSGNVHPLYAWLGILCYGLQIYFDFGAYSDMAIGLGLIFGFHFQENFAWPYISKSIREFWRRWHISLSSWFRDYVYIPLGGNRRGERRTCCNLLVVFFLTGIWHGAAWQYLVWGLFHGAFLIWERSGVEKILKKLPGFLQHLYTLLVVSVGWVFFRADSLGEAFRYLRNLFSCHREELANSAVVPRLTNLFLLLFVISLIGATPAAKKIGESRLGRNSFLNRLFYLLLWGVSVLYLVGLSYNPFIYFKF